MNDFKLVINEITYEVQCSKEGKKHSYATILTVAFPCLPHPAPGCRLISRIFLINPMTKKALENRVQACLARI